MAAGAAVTVGFLVAGITSMGRGGDPYRSQKLMRGRVYAQAFTVCAFIGYGVLTGIRMRSSADMNKKD